MTHRIAVVDVGTNTALLLVADGGNGRLQPLRDERRFVRLGEGVDGTRQVSERALHRLDGVLREYRSIAEEEGADLVCVAGTSASRDATNRDRLESTVRSSCGMDYDILDGQVEAVLSFAGTMAAIDTVQAEATVVDVGGGSTEMVRGTTGAPVGIMAAASADVGSVRVTERFFSSLPPAEDELAGAQAWVSEILAPVAEAVGETRIVVGAAGTAVVLAALHHGAEPRQGAWPAIDRSSVIAWRKRLSALSADEVLALDRELLFGRADVFAGGVLVLERAMLAVGAHRLVVSPWGLRHGLALRALGLVDGV